MAIRRPDGSFIHGFFSSEVLAALVWFNGMQQEGEVLEMYTSRSSRVCNCFFRLRILLFSSLLSWTIRPVHSYRTIEYTHTVLPNFHIVIYLIKTIRVIIDDPGP
jgi:hypothetical protein